MKELAITAFGTTCLKVPLQINVYPISICKFRILRSSVQAHAPKPLLVGGPFFKAVDVASHSGNP